jgi:hypothetical protein
MDGTDHPPPGRAVVADASVDGHWSLPGLGKSPD